jgi:hypothetical protein
MAITRYFMNLRDGSDELLDPEGTEHPSLDSLRTAVLREARELMSADAKEGLIDFRFRIDAEDSEGVVVYSLSFKHALNIIPETGA